MATDVNLVTSNSRLGTTVTVTRRLIDYDFTYTDENGVHQHKTGTATWPDLLLSAGLPVGWFKDNQEASMVAAGRIVLGIDSGA